MNICDVLRKEVNMKSWKKEELIKEENEKEYKIPDGGDFNLYCQYNNKLELDTIETEFKKIGINIICEREIKEDEMWIHISDDNNEIMSEKYEFDEEMKEELIEDFENDFENDNEIVEILKKVDSNYFYESHNYNESIMILALALYLSKKMDLVLFDCYNGCYLNKTKIEKIISNINN